MFRRIKTWLFGSQGMPIEQQASTHGPECFRTIASTDPHIDNEPMDPLMLAAMNRCIETGGIVIANRDEDGNCTIRDVD